MRASKTVESDVPQLSLKVLNDEGMEKLLKQNLANIFPTPTKEELKIDLKSVYSEAKKERTKKIKMLRSIKREEIMKERNLAVHLKSHLVIGSNQCLKEVQKGSVSLIIVDGQNIPQILLKFLLPLCLEKKVSIIGLQCVKQISLTSFGFPSVIFGFKKTCNEKENHFNAIVNYAKSLVGIGKEIIQLIKPAEQLIKPAQVTENKINEENNMPKTLLQKECKVDNYHLKRTSLCHRTYEPKKKCPTTQTDFGSDFIKCESGTSVEDVLKL